MIGLTLALSILMPMGCGSTPTPPGMVRVEGGEVVVIPDTAGVTVAPFFMDLALASSDGRPTVGLSWDQAQARCAARGLRLPTDAEWQLLTPQTSGPNELWGEVFQWTATRYAPPAGQPTAPEMRGARRVVRGSCCPFMPAWDAPDHRAAYPQDRRSSWIGYRCAGPIDPGDDANLALDAQLVLPPAALDEGEAVRQVLAGLWGPDRAPTDPAVQELIHALPEGATVADVGCGLGVLSLELQRAVGPQGQVLAVDIDPEVLHFVRAVAKAQGADGIRTVQATPGDASLPTGCCELVLLYDMANSLREEDLAAFVASVALAVAPGGKLAVYHLPGPPPPTKVLEGLKARGLEQTLTVRDPTTNPTEPERHAEKLWVFTRP